MNKHASNSRIVRPKELVAQDLIAFSPRLGAFTVMDTNGIHVVKLHPTESCSCPVRKNCIHMLSVKLGLRMELGENDLQPQNTAVVKKRVREPKHQKPGRKRPRPGDISLENLEQGDPEQEDMEQRMEQQDMEQDMEQRMEQQDMEQENLELHMEQIDMERNMEQANTEQHMEQQEDMERYMEQQEALEQCMEQENQNMEQQEKQNLEQAEQNEITAEDEKIRQLSDLLKEMSADKSILSHFLKQNEISFDKVITSTPKSDLKRDIRYSLEVWIAAEKNKLFHNLNINEKRIMQSNQWLNDIIIDSAMNLLTYQFPDLEGFQSCQLAHQLDFDRHERLFVQIINRSQKGWRLALVNS